MLKKFFDPRLPIRRREFWQVALAILVVLVISILPMATFDNYIQIVPLVSYLWVLPLFILMTYKRFKAIGWDCRLLFIMALCAAYVIFIAVWLWMMAEEAPELIYFFGTKKTVAWYEDAVPTWEIWSSLFMQVFALFVLAAGSFSSEKERQEMEKEMKGPSADETTAAKPAQPNKKARRRAAKTKK